MSASPPSSSPAVGRLTGVVLGLIVFVCMVMIGAAGYVKYEIDHAEAVMVAPGSAFTADQEAFDQLRRALGYSGFVGFAQNYATTHDDALLSDMRAQAKIADDMIAHLPEKTPSESRHDLQAILAVFDAALKKAEKSGNDPAGFTEADMTPLYAALPVLDSRLESAMESNRLAAQERLQFWSMLLTLVSWVSLIIASALAVGIYLTLRDRNSTPLRALAQSVKNMARGDMRTSIWGMERQDMIGELARAMDLARYNFSQLPDMSLLSEQGPVRLRFEGNTRSLFEAMMRVISRDSEQVRQQATGLADAVNKQQEAIALISSRVEAVLHNVEKRGLDGDQQVRQVLQSMMGSSQGLRNAQEHASDQLNRILPYLQERAQGMAEIAQITGKQVAQVLAGLTLSERGLRSSAEHSEEAIKKLSSVADNLGERMFGAVNLLQASGKVLAETTEKTQNRLNEAINALNSGIPSVQVAAAPESVSPVMTDFSARLEYIVSAMEAAQKKMDERLQAISLPKESAPLQSSEDDMILVDDTLIEIKAGFDATTRQIAQLQGQYERLYEAVKSKPPEDKIDVPAQDLTFVDQLLGEIKAGFGTTTAKIEQVQGQYERLHELVQSKPVEIKVETPEQDMAFVGQLLGEIKTGFNVTAARIEQVHDQYEHLQDLVQSRAAIEDEAAEQDPAFVDQILDNIKTGFDATAGKMEQMQKQYERLQDVALRRPPIEVKIDPPPFLRDLVVDVKTSLETVGRQVGQMREQLSTMMVANAAHPANADEKMQAQWYQMMAQIEATRTAIEQTIMQEIGHIGSRIDTMDSAAPQVDPAAFRDAQKQMEQQTQILEELVTTLGMLDMHMQQLKSEIEQQKPDAIQARL